MTLVRAPAALLAALTALAGCDAQPASDPAAGPAGGASQAAAMEFRGHRPCVDCRAIASWLRLEQDGQKRRYTLVERYLGESGERRFEERGDWRDDDGLLRLRSDADAQRTYARLPGHRLQARASDGGSLPAAADDEMVLTTFHNGP